MMLKDLILYFVLFVLLITIIFISIKLYKKNKKENNIKKKIFYTIPTILYCCVVIVVLLFSNTSKLNYVEEQVYNRIITMVNEEKFFNPKEARILDVVVKYEYNDDDRNYSNEIEEYYIKIIGTNKVGGTINKCYKIYYSDYSQKWNNYDMNCEDIYKSGVSYKQLSSTSIKKINKSLQKYWNNLGL